MSIFNGCLFCTVLMYWIYLFKRLADNTKEKKQKKKNFYLLRLCTGNLEAV